METFSKDVIDGFLITKDKRIELFGKVNGGSNSTNPEKFQLLKIVERLNIPVSKTNIRINFRTNQLVNVIHPNKEKDGFDYSENFDGLQTVNNKKIYINLKCIVGQGGAQTRSLREVYWFIQGQLNVLKVNKDIYFVNILDGDEAHKSLNKFNYLLNMYPQQKPYIYVGDLKNYFEWFNNTIVKDVK